MLDELLKAAALMTALTFVFGVLLAFANLHFRVEEDPRLARVSELLGGSNCGACGKPGCGPFARALLSGEVDPAQCTVSPKAAIAEIAALLGVEQGAVDKRVARLHCAGGRSAVRVLARYEGSPTCAAAALSQHGGRSCSYGCLGLGDCERACGFGAIRMNEEGLPEVDPERCTACGDCVSACPARLFSLEPLNHRVLLQCSSPLVGDAARASCAVACDGCGRCVQDAPAGLMEMRAGLPHQHQPARTPERSTYRCPSGALQWVEAEQLSYDVPVSALRRHYG